MNQCKGFEYAILISNAALVKIKCLAFAMKQHVPMLPSLTHKEIGTSTNKQKNRIKLNLQFE